MLVHLPNSIRALLFSLFQIIWKNGTLPNIWKKSIIVPILKQGKPRKSVDSYRPIALNSHCGKLFEKIVQQRLLFYCEKNNIIPAQQAGFRKKRSCADHLVKLSSCIKSQFAKRKSLLACFFDIKKAYDHVWHARLLNKLGELGISGNIYNYIKSFLKDRLICTRVNTTYSTFKTVDIGIPQGAIIAPILFSILVSDLPKHIANDFKIVQYADDICIWLKTNIKKHTKKRFIIHTQKHFQIQLDNLLKYMSENGFQLSHEKTHLMFFNNGQNPSFLPKLHLEGTLLEYKSHTKFLGVYFTAKHNWKYHIDYLIDKARKRYNFLKLISKQPWSQNQKTLLQLAIALVRSKLIYGQEVYYTAPKYLLNKLQSLDSKTIKMVLSLPICTNTLKCYTELNILSLDDQRKLAVSNYVLRCKQVDNSVDEEIHVDSNKNYPKRSQNIKQFQPIYNYTKEVFDECNIDISNIHKSPIIPRIPPWEHIGANYDLEYTSVTKSENINLVELEAKEHLSENYQNALKVYTDGSVLENQDCGSAFIIPELNIKRSYNLGKGSSIFTCELYAILFAITQLIELNLPLFHVVINVDSKSVLQSLKSWDCNAGTELIFEIKHIIHILRSNNTIISFCWVPSHCKIFWNDKVDILAKQGAKNENAIKIENVPLSFNELKSQVKSKLKPKIPKTNISVLSLPRKTSSLLLKFKLNIWRTKYVEDIKCVCKEDISINHMLYNCDFLNNLYRLNNIILDPNKDITEILNDKIILKVIDILLESPLKNLL